VDHHLGGLAGERPHEIQPPLLVHPVNDYPVKQLLPEKDTHLFVLPLLLQTLEILLRRLLLLLPTEAHSHPRPSVPVSVPVSVASVALWSVVALRPVLMHGYLYRRNKWPSYLSLIV